MSTESKTLESALRLALFEMEVFPIDEATVTLALGYATAIDRVPEQISKLGPQLLACLESLLMTPRSRAAVVKGASHDQPKRRSPLDELRERRDKRTAG